MHSYGSILLGILIPHFHQYISLYIRISYLSHIQIRAGKKESSPRLRDARESTPRPRETTPPKKAVKLKEAPAPAAKKGPKAPPKKVKSPATTPQFRYSNILVFLYGASY